MNDSPDSDSALHELEAMRAIYEALKPLDDNGKRRVLSWVSSRVVGGGSARSNPAGIPSATSPSPLQDGSAQGTSEEGLDLPTFYARVRPEALSDKALAVSYWLQEYQHQEDIDSQQVNTELKHLGHGLGNVTRTMDALVGSRPKLIIQTRKKVQRSRRGKNIV